MRILHAAKKLEERIETCSNCHSILAVTEDDIYCCSNETFEYTCPVCRQNNNYGSLTLDQLFPWKMEDTVHEEISGDNSMRLNTF
jgi:hypothetical protein